MAIENPVELIGKLQTLLDYADTADLAKARHCRTVCQKLLISLPMRSRGAQQELDMNVQGVQEVLKQVNDWITANEASLIAGGSGNNVRLGDLRGYRG
jgi:hypothetical protein